MFQKFFVLFLGFVMATVSQAKVWERVEAADNPYESLSGLYWESTLPSVNIENEIIQSGRRYCSWDPFYADSAFLRVVPQRSPISNLSYALFYFAEDPVDYFDIMTQEELNNNEQLIPRKVLRADETSWIVTFPRSEGKLFVRENIDAETGERYYIGRRSYESGTCFSYYFDVEIEESEE